MIKKIPAIKIGMTSSFDDTGSTVPVTLVQPFTCVITEIKRPEKHGYSAVQVAYKEALPKRVNKPLQGVLKHAGIEQVFSAFFEIRMTPEELSEIQVGQVLDPHEILKNWDQVKVVGTSKGKGFAGAVKRHHFAGQQRTHGDPDNRRPQSGNATDPARVFKGSRRPGRMGNERVTQKGLTVFEYDPALNLLALSGSVPGANGSLVFVTFVSESAPEEEGA